MSIFSLPILLLLTWTLISVIESKCRGALEPSQAVKMEFYAKIVGVWNAM